jgi:choline dehydrogenase-like flavoprotein
MKPRGRQTKDNLCASCSPHRHLYVVDTSFFVSIGALNPWLTAIANATCMGDQLLTRLT